MTLCLLIVGYKGLLVLEKCLKNNIKPDYIVTYNDTNSSCNSFNNIIEICKKNNIKYLVKKLIKSELKNISNSYNYIFCIGWQFMLDLYDNLIIIHDSYLPEYKGFSPTINYLINKSDYLAITAFKPTSKVDTGDIYYMEKINISQPIKLKQAFEILSEIYFNAINKIINDKIELFQISHENETFCVWRDNNDMFINWEWSINKILRFIYALTFPYSFSKSYIILNNNKYVIKIKDAVIIDDINIINRNEHIGKVYNIDNNNPIIICKNGLLKITDYEIENNIILNKLKTRFV